MAKLKILVAYDVDAPDLERLRAVSQELDVIYAPVTLDPTWQRVFATRSRSELLPLTPKFPRATLDALADADVVYCLGLPVDTVALAPKLRWIANLGSGTDQYQAFGLHEANVTLTSSKGVAARTIAEFVMAQLLLLFKRFPERLAHQREHRWKRLQHMDLHGRTLGIVGFGEIGSEIARMASAFGMRVLATRRHADGPLPANVAALYPPGERCRMLAECDACAVAVALTPETRGMVGRAELEAMRHGGILVDVSRGGVTDSGALLHALQSGQLRGAALDVFEEEPLPADSPLWDAPNLVISPHNAVGLDNYSHHAFSRFIENVQRHLRGEALVGIVDPRLGY